MFKKTIEILLTILLSALFATVFMESSELADGIFTAKTFYFYLITVPTIALSAIYLISVEKGVKLSVNRLDAALLIFYSYSIIRLIFTEQVPLYNDRIICFTFLIIFYFIFRKVFCEKNSGQLNYSGYTILFAFISAGFLQALIGLFQTYEIFGYYQGQFIAVGSFNTPASYAGFIESVLPVSFGLSQLLEEKRNIDKILKKYSLITFIACVLVLPSTQTRGSWVASFGGILFILFIKYNLKEKIQLFLNKGWKRFSAGAFSITIIIVVFLALYQIRPASAFGRLLIWKISTNMLLDNPIFGIGYDSFGNNYNNYQAKYFSEKERSEFEKYVAGNVWQSHNEFIETIAELGLAGIILFSFAFYNVFKKTHIPNVKEDLKTYQASPLSSLEVVTGSSKWNVILNSSRASLLTLLIAACFSYPFQILPTFINTIFLISLVSSGIASSEKPRFSFKLNFNVHANSTKTINTFPDSDISGQYFHSIYRTGRFASIYPIFLYLIIFILLASFVHQELNNYSAYKEWEAAKRLSYFQNYRQAIEIYQKIYPILKLNGNFLRNYGGALSLAERHKEALEILKECEKINTRSNLYILLGNSYEAMNFYDKAKESYLKASYIVPSQLYPKYLLANLYEKLGEHDSAKSIALYIVASKPKVSSMATQEMKEEMRKLIKE